MSTLADEFIKAGHDAPPNHNFDIFRFVGHLIQQSHKFLINENARTAVSNIISSKPSSLYGALHFARLPFPITWMEWEPPEDGELRSGQYPTSKVGALLRQDGSNVIKMFTAWKHKRNILMEDGWFSNSFFSPKIQKYMYNTAQLGVSAFEVAWDFGLKYNKPSLDTAIGNKWIGSKKEWFQYDPLIKKYSDNKYALKDPIEKEYIDKIDNLVCFRVFAEAGGWQSIELSRKDKNTAALMCDVSDDMARVIALLILMNSKNCVEIEKVTPSAKLNKARVKRGETPFVEFSTVKIKLNKRDEQAAASGEMSPEEKRRHEVRGHFKVRKTGVFYWRPFWRGSEAKGFVLHKTYEVENENAKE